MESDQLVNRIWVGIGIMLIPINLVCLIGAAITRNPYEILWISHYSGLLEGIVLIFQFKKPFLNGMYSFLFIFQLGSVLIHIINPGPVNNYLDIFYWLNHFPHVVGFYMIMKYELSLHGISLGYIFLLFMMVLTAQILHLNEVEYLGINTVFRSYFLLNLGLSIGWYIILIIIQRNYRMIQSKN